jgi:capsular exopolysaccharide synthesis family protein
MEPVEYLRAIRRRWLVVVVATLALAGGAWATTALPSPAVDASYQSGAILLRTGGLPLETMEAFVELRPVAVRVADRIGFEDEADDLTSRVSTQSNNDTGLLYITTTGSSAEEARHLANAYSKALVDYIQDGFVASGGRDVARQIAELQREIADIDARLAAVPPAAEASILEQQRLESATLLGFLSEAYSQAIAASLNGPGITVIQPASLGDLMVTAGIEVPESALVRVAIGGIVGLALGIALALMLARFDTRIRSREAAEEHFQLPVLAEIPVIPRGDRMRVVMASDSSSSATGEAFGLLGAEMVRVPVLHGDGDGAAGAGRVPPQTILVTSAGNAEGKSTVVANLAVAMSEMGKRVLIISCDFRRPAVHRLFGVPNTGLAQALERASANGKPVLEGHIQTTSFPDIWVVPSGPASKRPGELLSSDGMRRALNEARSAADVILLDTAPILAGSEATQLLPDVDAVLLVARSGTTTSQLAERASGLLRRLRAPVLGVAFNAAESPAAPKGVRPS